MMVSGRIIAILVLAVIVIASGYLLTTQQFAGFDVLALSDTRVESTNTNIAGEVWVATVAVNGGGQKLVADEKTSSEMSTSGVTLKGVEITADIIKYNCRYDLEDTEERFNNFDVFPISVDLGSPLGKWTGDQCYVGSIINRAFSIQLYETTCKNNGGIPLTCTDIIEGRQCYGVQRTEKAKLLNFKTFVDDYEIEISVKNSENEIETLKLTPNLGAKTASGNMYIKDTGQLSGTQDCPTISLASPIYDSVNDTVYLAKFQTSTPNEPNWATFTTLTTLQNAINQHNNEVNDLLDSAPSSEFSGSRGPIIIDELSSTGEVEDRFRVNVDMKNNPPKYPLLQMILKTSWIGKPAIGIPETKPQITSAPNVVVQQGKSVNTKIGIRNDGEGGTIKVSLECDAPVTVQSVTSKSIALANGENGEVEFTIGGAEGDGDCKVTASDSNDVGIFDTATFSVSVTEICDIEVSHPWKLVFYKDGTCAAVCDPETVICIGTTELDVTTCLCVEATNKTECDEDIEQACLDKDNTVWEGVPKCACSCEEGYLWDLQTQGCLFICDEGEIWNSEAKKCEVGGEGIDAIFILLAIGVVFMVVGFTYYYFKGKKVRRRK